MLIPPLAMTTNVITEIDACRIISIFARVLNGKVSVGLKAKLK